MKNKKEISIDINIEPIKEAIKKVDELVTKLKECIELIHQLSKLAK